VGGKEKGIKGPGKRGTGKKVATTPPTATNRKKNPALHWGTKKLGGGFTTDAAPAPFSRERRFLFSLGKGPNIGSGVGEKKKENGESKKKRNGNPFYTGKGGEGAPLLGEEETEIGPGKEEKGDTCRKKKNNLFPAIKGEVSCLRKGGGKQKRKVCLGEGTIEVEGGGRLPNEGKGWDLLPPRGG